MKLHRNVTIQGEFLPWTGNENKLIAQLAAKQLPDVMVTSTAWFSEFAQKGAYLNLAPYFHASHWNNQEFAPGSIAGNSIGRKLFMIPNIGAIPAGGVMGGVVLLYNKAMFKKAHLSAPSPNWTLQQFVHVSQLLTIDGNGKNATSKGFSPKTVVQWGNNIGYSSADAVWNELLPAYGGWYWNTKKTASTIDSQAAVKAATFLKDLVNKWHASITPAAATGIADPFAAGKVAMEYAWSNQAQTEASTVNFPVGVSALPRGPYGRGFFRPTPGEGVPTNGWAIAANTKHPRTAWEFVKFLTSSPIALKARGTTGVEQLAYRPLAHVWASMLSPADRLINKVGLLEWNQAPHKNLPGWGGEYSQFWNDMTQELEKFYLGQASVKTVLKTIQTQSNQLLKQYHD